MLTHKCPTCCNQTLVNKVIIRVFEGIRYKAPVEQCTSCGEILSGWQSALAQLEAINDPKRDFMNEINERGLRKLRIKRDLCCLQSIACM